MPSRVIIDIATSGADPSRHSILELCAVKVDESFNYMDVFNCRILYQDLFVSPAAVAFNGIDLRNTSGLVPQAAALDGLCRFLSVNFNYEQLASGNCRTEKYTHVGFGAAFDATFLRSFLGDRVFSTLFLPRVSELGSMFEAAMFAGLVSRPTSARMADLAIAAGVDVPADGAHSALADAQMALSLGRSLYVLLTEAGQQLRGQTPQATFQQPPEPA